MLLSTNAYSTCLFYSDLVDENVACSNVTQSKSLLWVHALECNVPLHNKLSLILNKQYGESTREENNLPSYGLGNEYPNYYDINNNVIQLFSPPPLIH